MRVSFHLLSFAILIATAVQQTHGQVIWPVNSTSVEGGYSRRPPPMAMPAECIPEKRTIKLYNEDNPSLLYFPSCTRVERCGGCCSQSLLSCQPTQTERQEFQVVVKRYVPGRGYQMKGIEIIELERHLKCKCDCRIKATDCTRLQEYRPKECQCVCINYDEKKKCLSDDTRMKKWDPFQCTCECLRTRECSTGYAFNRHSCSCEPVKRIRGPYNEDEKYFSPAAPANVEE